MEIKYNLYDEPDSRRYIIKLTGYDTPKYVFNGRTIVNCPETARKFTRTNTAIYVKKHREQLSGGYEIIKIKD